MASLNIAGVLKPAAKGHGGAHVAHHKNTSAMPVERMPVPASVTIPLSQHIGAPNEAQVKVGDEVKVGQVIGSTDAFVSAPVHATISGTVKAIKPVRIVNGNMVNAVVIESDGEMALSEDVKPPVIETKQDFLNAVRASGLVGLGGAGFPTHVKLAFKEDAGVDTLIINAAECEPYITVDHREMLDHPQDILSGIKEVVKWLGFKNAYIGIEDNKADAFKMLLKAMEENEEFKDVAQLICLPSTYPQGAEKVLIYSATGRQVPPGKLPSDVGCVVMNVQSVSFLGRYLKTGKPLVSRSLTVDGSAIAEPKNLRAPLGTMYSDIIEYCGGFKEDPYKIMAGGPMMGIATIDAEVPLLKNNNAITCLAKDYVKVKPTRACIRCGRCVDACPMCLEPTLIEKKAHLGDVDGLTKASVMTCMECGSCAFACPSGRPLVQYMRLGKAIIREAGAKK